MSRAPTINTPVIPDAGGMPYQHLDIPISQTARAAAETLGTAGSTLMDYAVKQQNLVDESTANDALTNYRTSAMSAWDQYGRLQGKHAVDEFGNYSQTLKQQLDQTISGLTPRQQRLAKASLEGVCFNMLGAGQRHNSQQDKIYSDQAADGALASLAQQAVMYRGDPANLDKTIEQAKSQMELKGEVNGWAPETLNAAVMSTKSLIVGNVVNTLLSEDPNKAQAVFKQYQNQLDGPTQARLSEAIRNKTLAVNGAQIASGYIAPYTGPASDPGMTYSNMLRWESNNRQFDENGQPITSKAGAIGIAQLMPDTAKTVAAQHGIAFDPEKLKTDEAYNKRLGQLYFHDLLDQFGGNQMLAVAAYNAGPGAVNGWISKYGDPRTGQISNADFAAKIPYAETKTYVGRVLGGNYDQNAGELNDQTLGKMLIDARQKYGNDPQLLASIQSNIRAQYAEQRSQRQGDDANYLEAFKNEMAWLQGGHDLSEPSKFTESGLIARFGPERGMQLWDSYSTAQEIGQARKAVVMASPQDTATYVNSLRNQADTSPADAVVNQRKLAAAVEAVKQRDTAVKADAAGYVEANDPGVRGAWDTFRQDGSVENLRNAIGLGLQAQRRIGVPESDLKPFSSASVNSMMGHFSAATDPAMKIQAFMPILQSGDDETVRLGLAQVVKAGAPQEIQFALEAYRQGRPDSAKRIVAAITAPPSKVYDDPDNTSTLKKNLLSEVQSAFADDYAVFAAQADLTKNPAYLSKRADMIAKIMTRMVAGYGPENQSTNAAMARKDLMGDMQPVNDSHVGPIFVPGGYVADDVTKGLSNFRDAKITTRLFARLNIPGQSTPVVSAIIGKTTQQLKDEIRFVNIDDGVYGMVMPGGAFVADDRGNPMTINVHDAMTWAKGTGSGNIPIAPQ